MLHIFLATQKENNLSYQPPYTITPRILHLIAEISENLGRWSVLQEQSANIRLRRINRIRTIQGSLAIEGNTLMEDLLSWLKTAPDHALITSCVFHYEFEFIHPFIDGNGRMGRLWQTLILSQWNALFLHIPVESMVYAQQENYYQALNESTLKTDSAPFIEFMLRIILEACHSTPQETPQATPQATPQVLNLLNIIDGKMSREQLQQALNLKDRKSFRERYLVPALSAGLIEMTLPDKPKSSLQKYFITTLGATLANQ